MRELTPRERRTIRLALLGLGAYLILFAGFKTASWLEGKRAVRAELQHELAAVRAAQLAEENKRLRLQALRSRWRLDPARTAEPTVVGDARQAIEAEARACQIGLGFSRESPGRRRAHELAVFQVNGSAAGTALARFLHRVQHLGYPVVLDSIEIKAAPKPGAVTFSFAIALLDHGAWLAETEA
ncbi:MAG: hypothetical protein JXQ29_08545 [Planctomycetes bacterium]|nr:hypothetical protein [Planctomycetota bacterium]